MRVRRFELRLIGICLVIAWAVAAALVLLAYRPGGPLDILVGLTVLVPTGIAALAVAWPPVARGRAPRESTDAAPDPSTAGRPTYHRDVGLPGHRTDATPGE